MEELNENTIVEYITYNEPNHSSSLVQKLQSQREDGRFCDIVLHVQGKLFHAHRSVLALSSPYFDSILKKHKATREQLTVACDNHKVFNDLLNFMYDGNITIHGGNVSELLRLSNHLMLDNLQNYCEDYLTNFMNLTNCVKIREMSEKYARNTLLKVTSLFISANWDKVTEQDSFLTTRLQSLESILGDKEIEIPNENVLKIITKWVSQDVENRELNLKRLLTFVEWDKIPSEIIFQHFKLEKLYEVSARSAFYLLAILKENNIELGEKATVYEQLRNEFETDGEMLDSANFMEMAVAAAMDKLEDDGDANGNHQVQEIITQSIPETSITAEPKLPPLKISLAKSTSIDSFVNKKTRATSNFDEEEEEEFQDEDDYTDFQDEPAGPSDSDSSYSEVKSPIKRNTRKGRPAKSTRRSSILRSGKNSTTTKRKDSLDIKNTDQDDYLSEDQTELDEGDEKENNESETPSLAKGKRKVGKPRKIITSFVDTAATEGGAPPKRKRGRPKKHFGVTEEVVPSDLIRFEENSEGDNSQLDNNDNDYNDTSSDSDPERRPKRNPPLTKPYRGRGKCPHCSYVEHSVIRLERHIAKVHSKEIIYNCTICEFSCNWNREFYIHMKVHFQGPPYNCECCSYTCDRVQLLLKHRMRHTDERPFKCDQCKYTSRTEWNLRIHMRCHTGEKPYQCDLCGRRFSMKAGLDQHVQSHRKDRPFLCDTCGFATKYKSYLVSHMRIHAGTAFRCEYPNCEYFSPKRSQLKAHMRTHKAEKVHICAICGRGFVERSHLVRHERIHLTEKPFKCDHCEYTSSRRDKLKEHTDKHHTSNGNGEAAAKVTYKPRKPRRPKQEPKQEPLIFSSRTEFAPQHQSQASEQTSQHRQTQSSPQPSQQATSAETILLHAHSSEFQTPVTMIYQVQEHLGHHVPHQDHNAVRETMLYQNHKHHNPHHHSMEVIPATMDQRLLVAAGHQMAHNENHPQCPQQHPDLNGLHVGAFMAVY